MAHSLTHLTPSLNPPAHAGRAASLNDPLSPDPLTDFTHLSALGHHLDTLLQKQIKARSSIERRWIEDMRQYMGYYDPDTARALRSSKGRASVFLNLTRSYTNLSQSQLSDMLFPNDSPNWSMAPTPDPDMERDADDPSPATVNGTQFQDPETGEPVSKQELAREARQIAEQRAKRMERVIHDQFVECDFAGEARKALHYSAVIGTGVLCGPEVRTLTRHKWETTDPASPASAEAFRLTTAVEYRKQAPVVRNVIPWDFYPDMSAAEISEAEFVFERSYLTRKQIKLLLKGSPDNGYLPESIEQLLRLAPSTTHRTTATTTTLRDIAREISSDHAEQFGQPETDDTRFEVWTYRGPVPVEALIEAGTPLEEPPFAETEAIVVFSGDTVLKAALHPMDTEANPYSVFCWQNDDFSIFGYGAPHMGRNEQRIINTAWRLMLDNSSKAAGPQIVAKRSAITPQVPSYDLSPWKLWWADETVPDVRSAFSVFTFPSLQTEIANILQMAQGFLSQTMGLPPQSAANQSGQMPHTLGGMAMLMNSSNTDRRRQVRQWDDCITKPLIERFYHWNMQYHADPEIKGDFEVHAKGSSALLLREQQALNLMAVLDKYAAHPATAEALKTNAALRKIAQAMHIPDDELVRSDDEIEQRQRNMAESAQQQAEQARQQTLETMQAQARFQAEAGIARDQAEIAAKAQAQAQLKALEQAATADRIDPAKAQMEIEALRAHQSQQRLLSSHELELLKQQGEQRERAEERALKIQLAQIEYAKHQQELQLEALKYANQNEVDYKRLLADLKKHRQRLSLDAQKFNTEVALKNQMGPQGNYGLDD